MTLKNLVVYQEAKKSYLNMYNIKSLPSYHIIQFLLYDFSLRMSSPAVDVRVETPTQKASGDEKLRMVPALLVVNPMCLRLDTSLHFLALGGTRISDVFLMLSS